LKSLRREGVDATLYLTPRHLFFGYDYQEKVRLQLLPVNLGAALGALNVDDLEENLYVAPELLWGCYNSSGTSEVGFAEDKHNLFFISLILMRLMLGRPPLDAHQRR